MWETAVTHTHTHTFTTSGAVEADRQVVGQFRKCPPSIVKEARVCYMDVPTLTQEMVRILSFKIG